MNEFPSEEKREVRAELPLSYPPDVQAKQLKHEIRADAGKTVCLLLIMQLVMQFGAGMAAVLYEAIAGVTGYGMVQPVHDFIFSFLPVIVCESAVLILGLFWFRTDVKQLFRKPTFAKGEGYKALPYVGMALGALQVGSLLFAVVYYLFDLLFHIEISVPSFEMDTSNVLVNVLTFAYVVVVGPFLEELFFRGVLFQKLRKYGDMPVIFFTAILFAMFHMNFVQFSGPLLFGIAIGIVFSRTNSLWLCWIIHMLNNLFAAIYDYIPEAGQGIYDSVLTVVLLMLSAVCFVLIFKELRGIFARRGNCTVLSARAKFGAMLNNAWFYVFLALWFAIAMTTQIML